MKSPRLHRKKHSGQFRLQAIVILAIQSLKTRGSDDRNLDNGRILTKTRRDLILVISAISAAGGMGRMEAPPLPSQEAESLSRFLRFKQVYSTGGGTVELLNSWRP